MGYASFMIVACQACGRQYNIADENAGNKARCLCGCHIDIPVPRAHDAPMRHCATCGGPLEEEATRCEYCGGSVDRDRARYTLVCPNCFARLPQNAKYCIECAVAIRPEQLDLVTGSSLKCPRCEKELHGRVLETVQFFECGQCCGMWLSNAAFKEISRRKVEEFRDNPFPEGPSERDKGGLEPVKYVRCPQCNQLMHRTNFGRRSGVIIDQCKDHGIWLDDQELERIARFIAEGGLQLARKDEADEQERRARRARATAELSAGGYYPEASSGGGAGGLFSLLGRLLGG